MVASVGLTLWATGSGAGRPVVAGPRAVSSPPSAGTTKILQLPTFGGTRLRMTSLYRGRKKIRFTNSDVATYAAVIPNSARSTGVDTGASPNDLPSAR